MSIVKGKNVILQVNNGGMLMPVACGQNATLTTDTDLAETSTEGTGTWKTQRLMRNSWQVDADGLVSFDTNMTPSQLMALQFAGTPVFLSWEATDDNGLVESFQGYALVKTHTLTTAFNGLYKFNVLFIGNGKLTITDTPIDPNEIGGRVMRYEYDGTGTESGGNVLPAISVLAGKSILAIERDGLYHRPVQDAVPVGKQFKRDAEDDTVIIFAEDLPSIQLGEMIDIFYQN